MDSLILVLFFAALLGLIPAFIAKNKGRSFGGWWFFGWMLWIVALPASLVVSNRNRKCHRCLEWIERDATICRYCHTAVPGGGGQALN